MLSPSICDQVRRTAPLLQAEGQALTRAFYARLFRFHPALREMFNQGHQHDGEQSRALAGAVTAYALHVDDPTPLRPYLARIMHKHVSLGVRAEHYDLVGQELLAAMDEVFAGRLDAATRDAWAAAYGQLATLMIEEEAAMYRASAVGEGGWTGWRSFRVTGRHCESEQIVSFELAPADGGRAPDFLPGQYVSVRVQVPALGFSQVRQYSLSAAPDPRTLRISVKREIGGEAAPDGHVSNVLHDSVFPGDLLELSPPAGEFVLRGTGHTPVVLISAGVGATPLLSMLARLLEQPSPPPIRFLHACRNGTLHAWKQPMRDLVQRMGPSSVRVYYERPEPGDVIGRDHDHAGRMDLAAVREDVVLPDADYYLCGPKGFMREQAGALRALGVSADRIHAEVFGSGDWQT
ncbi:dihydropteridine reductase [Stenotrophomonas panacihumi]|uniref:Flavohemoprotein n=1 Tax=Stenotrophomonas panacihumi TaxID=676599 RepID=A0A0R0ABU3_9GAMM|nr:NO-inducible flavohemoprotein [Stenotrophomonas panacihumi]KRG38881.1 dihydropteridine reductase [Stenotrophomonas panacihumi]PTN54676.1 NO-inducible flavohemoprotein [Stenotrophomonas panacihumi]